MRRWLLLFVGLVAVTAHGFGYGYGDDDTGLHLYVLRIGASANAAGTLFRYEIEYTGAATVTAYHWKTGQQFVAGEWTVTLRDFYGNPISTTTITQTASSWQTLTLPTPVSQTVRYLDFEPVADAEIEFIEMGTNYQRSVQNGVDGQYGVVPVYIYVGNHSSAQYVSIGGTLVVESLGSDPFALPSCGDAGAISGWPYDSIELVHIADGAAATQTGLALIYPSPSPVALNWLQVDGVNAVSSGTINVKLDMPGMGTTEAPATQFYYNYGVGEPFAATPPVLLPIDGGEPFSLTVRPVGTSFDWARVSASLPDAGECDPIVRATYLGAMGKAGTRNDADFMFAYNFCGTTVVYPDRDNDGFGDSRAPSLACIYSVPAGQTTVTGDCDDGNRFVHPGAQELCDGIDNDCNGLVDADDRLTPPACELTAGVCAHQSHLSSQCIDGGWAACNGVQYGPLYEGKEVSCDGVDNDCNGVVDDTSDGPLCANQRGVCAGSVAALCVDAGWAACTAANRPSTYQPAETSCDGLDNDCDGLTDGEDPDLAQLLLRCELQQGVCADSIHALQQCGDGSWAPCDVRQYGDNYQPVEDRCDGLDNDCDGLIDEGCHETTVTSKRGCDAFGGVMIAATLLWLVRRRRSVPLLATLLLGGCQRQPSPSQSASEFELPARVSRSTTGCHREGQAGFTCGDSVRIDAQGEASFGLQRVHTTSIAGVVPNGAEPQLSASRLSIARGVAHEVFEATRGGVEQSFEFLAPPVSGADLLVTLAVDGAEFSHADADALHFISADRTSGLRVGDARWVDASGASSLVELAFDGEQIVLRVPADVVMRSNYPAVLDPTITGEQPVGSLVSVRAPLAAYWGGALAFDGTNHLVVWSDERSYYQAPAQSYVAWISPDGGLSPVNGQPVGLPVNGWVMASNGSVSLVAWIDSSETHVDAVRVSQTGTVLDTSPLVLATAANNWAFNTLSVAYGAGEFLVAWTNNGADIEGVRVTTAGQLLDATPKVMAQGYPESLVGNATGFALLWIDSAGALKVNGIDVSGQLQAGTGQVVSTSPGIGAATMAGDPSGFLIAESVEDINYAWTLNLFHFDGGVSAGATPVDGGHFQSVALGFDGTDYLVVWSDVSNHSIAAIRADTSAAALDPIPTPILSTDDHISTLSCSTTECLALFTSPEYLRISSSLSALDPQPQPLVTTENSLTLGDVGASDAGYLAAWIDSRDGRVYATRLSTTGVVLDPDGVALSSPLATGAPGNSGVRVASDGTDFFVTWVADQLYAARVSAAGQPLDAPLGLGLSLYPNDVAFGSGQYVVVTSDLELFRFADGGWLDGPGILVGGAHTQNNGASIASDGVGYLVAFADNSNGHVYGTVVGSDGGVLSVPPVDIMSGGSNPTVVFDGTRYVVSDPQGYAAAVSVGGLSLPPFAFGVTGAPFVTGGPGTVAFDGREFLAVGTTWSYQPGTNVPALMVRRFSNQGGIGDFAFDAVDGGQYFSQVAIASIGDGTSLILYQLPDYSDEFQPARLFARIYDNGPTANGVACSVGLDCLSGFCVDGVCCDTACGGSTADCEACSVAMGAQVDGTCIPLPAATLCRGAWRPCDAPEFCDGLSPDCPPDAVLDAGVVCRPARSVCDPTEYCTGVDPDCPTDVVLMNGTACDDGNSCTGSGSCYYGYCAGGSAVDAGTPCDDLNVCSTASACSGTACVPVSWVSCPAPDDCHAIGYCDPDTQGCTAVPKNDGSACDGGACHGGVCAPVPDAGTIDSGSPDAGAPDAGPVDAGAPDGGAPDAGDDAGIDSGIDSGTPDASVLDAGARDAGPAIDGGVSPPLPAQGCGCGAGAPGVFAWAILLLLWRRPRGARR